MFFLKVDESPRCSFKRLFAHFVNILFLVVGALGLVSFILEKMHVKI